MKLAHASLATCLLAVSAHAAIFTSATLTASGPNTIFSVTGVYPADFATTFYSAPNAPFTYTFTVPTTPATPVTFPDPEPYGFTLDTPVTLNGILFPAAQVAFYLSGIGGGFDLCLNIAVCQEPVVTTFPIFSLYGTQVFTGTLTNPVFISGPVEIDQENSVIQSPVPEPATFLLSGIGIAALVVSRRQKRQST